MARALATLVALCALALSGCGYRDDNADAARLLSESFYKAYHDHDAVTVCRLLAPDLFNYMASRTQGGCPGYVRTTFRPQDPVPAAVSVVGDYRLKTVTPGDHPELMVKLLRFGSIWRIIEAPRLG